MSRFPPKGLIGLLLASAATMVAAAALDATWLSGAAAGLAALAVVAWAFAVRADAPLKPAPLEPRALAVRRATTAAALVYAWGALATLGVYTLSGLSWEHGWQYGAAMALIAAGVFAYAQWVSAGAGARDGRLRDALRLTALHGFAAAAALVYLAASGKLWAGKSDWAANQVFLAGGLAIVAICVRSGIKQVALARAVNPRESR